MSGYLPTGVPQDVPVGSQAQVGAPVPTQCLFLIGANASTITGQGPTAAQIAAGIPVYANSDPSALTGLLDGALVAGTGSKAGYWYAADGSGNPILWLQDGVIKAAVSNAAISVNTISSLAGTTGTFYVSMTDNLADAFSLKEGSNAYLTCVTTNSAETVDILKTLRVDTIKGKTGTTGTFSLNLVDNLASALDITEAANSYLKFTTTNSSEAVVIGQPLSVAASFSSPVTGVQSIADNGTITLPTGGWIGLVATSSAANKTGVILTAGTKQGQIIRLLNTSSNSLTFATAGTSNVADGTGSVIAALTAATFTWESGAARWFRG